ncbi:MAG: hypothetical protein IPL46_09850 [Saprospiraceae bacterium]|nr:hypothetical protein [Saprospiraceae bacterium]
MNPLPLIGPPNNFNAFSIPAKARFLAAANLTPCELGCDSQFEQWNVWSGCGDSADWFDPANWHQTLAPSITDAIYIPKNPVGGNYFPVINFDVTIKYLWVAPGAKFETQPGAQLTITK